MTPQEKVDILYHTTVFITTGKVPADPTIVAPDYTSFYNEENDMYFTVFATSDKFDNDLLSKEIFAEVNVGLIEPAMQAVENATAGNNVGLFPTPFHTSNDNVVGVIISKFPIFK